MDAGIIATNTTFFFFNRQENKYLPRSVVAVGG
jgi:hypothetical protein